jgi:hypothetical protein
VVEQRTAERDNTTRFLLNSETEFEEKNKIFWRKKETMMRYRVIGNGLPLLLLLLGVLCGAAALRGGFSNSLEQQAPEGGDGVSVVDAAAAAAAAASGCQSLNPSFVRRETFRSPAMIFRPGDAKDKFFHGEVPKGHIGVRDFFAEFVDEDGVSVPLHEVYLHHWVVAEFVLPKKNLAKHMDMVMRDMRNSHTPSRAGDAVVTLGRRHGHHHHHHHHHDVRSERQRHSHPLNYMGVGGETRGTETRYPAPFAMETGATAKIPKDFEAVWILNVHGIDTRGAVTKIGCTECRSEPRTSFPCSTTS